MLGGVNFPSGEIHSKLKMLAIHDAGQEIIVLLGPFHPNMQYQADGSPDSERLHPKTKIK